MPDTSAAFGALTASDIAALRVALVGYGEVGRIFGAALVKAGVRSVAAFDILSSDASWAREATARADRDNVVLVDDIENAIRDADLIISAVTAASTTTAAQRIATVCRGGTSLLDVNSASPRTKTGCAEVVNRAGGRYVEAAVMSSVPPYGIRVPMLLGGPHATFLQPTLAALNFAATVGAQTYGVVSAIKLCRSVFIKGLEALAVEGLLAARRYGVEREVLASLVETFPEIDWDRQASWFWRRVVAHGRRRAEEMREAGVAVGDVGVAPRMATATADVQQWIATLRAEGVFESLDADATWRDVADLIERK